MKVKDIYDLELHELAQVYSSGNDSITVMRVPGGWIYEFSRVGDWKLLFIPYNHEFSEG